MNPVKQRGDKDCLRACVASVLGVRYEDVPDLYHDRWGVPFVLTCLNRGLLPMRLQWSGDVRAWLSAACVYTIATGRTVNDTLHSVVYHGAQMAFDPAAEPAAFIAEPIDVILFVSIDPEAALWRSAP